MKVPENHSPVHTLRWFGRTDRGKVRKNNEDAFLGIRFNDREMAHLGRLGESQLDSCDLVFAVSDGMGGANAGEFASRIAVEKIVRLLPKAFRAAAAGMEAGRVDLLGELFSQIHRALTFLADSDEECRGMGATLSLCWFTPDWMYTAHIGDSRIYYFPAAGGVRQITEDDTHVGWLFRNGKLNEREARNHPRKNVLQRALGAGHQFVDPQVGKVGFERGDRFLLCTDGLMDGLFVEHLEELIRISEAPGHLENPVDRLIQRSLQNSGKDNTTAVLVEVV